jgi:hypothetical protein
MTENDDRAGVGGAAAAGVWRAADELAAEFALGEHCWTSDAGDRCYARREGSDSVRRRRLRRSPPARSALREIERVSGCRKRSVLAQHVCETDHRHDGVDQQENHDHGRSFGNDRRSVATRRWDVCRLLERMPEEEPEAFRETLVCRAGESLRAHGRFGRFTSEEDDAPWNSSRCCCRSHAPPTGLPNSSG